MSFYQVGPWDEAEFLDVLQSDDDAQETWPSATTPATSLNSFSDNIELSHFLDTVLGFGDDDDEDHRLGQHFSSSNTSWSSEDRLENFLVNFRYSLARGAPPPKQLAAAVLTAYAIVVACGIFGNVLVLAAVFGRPSMRTAHNFFVAALACADLFLCAVSMPITVWELLSEKWMFGYDTLWLCRMVMSAQAVPLFMSSMAIVAIAMDRYRSVVQNQRPPYSGSTVCLTCIGIVLVALLVASPLYFSAKLEKLATIMDMDEVSDILVCRQSWNPLWRMVYNGAACAFQFFLPIGFVMYMNLSVLLRLRHRPPSSHKDVNERRHRTNKLIVIVTLVFFFSWLPLTTFRLTSEVYDTNLLGDGGEAAVYAGLNLLGAANACTNPVLYAYFNDNFREEYRNLMPWGSWRQKRGPESVDLAEQGRYDPNARGQQSETYLTEVVSSGEVSAPLSKGGEGSKGFAKAASKENRIFHDM